MTLPGVIIAATVGSVVGAYFLYGIGRLLSQERLEGFFDTKPMRMLGFHSDDVAKAIGWFDRKGQITVLVCRCIPVVRSLISIPAGTAKMNMVRFAIYTLVGSLVWNAILCTLGFWGRRRLGANHRSGRVGVQRREGRHHCRGCRCGGLVDQVPHPAGACRAEAP